MLKKKKPKRSALTELQRRVARLERNFRELGDDVLSLKSDISSLKVTMKQVDDRTLRGETLMMSMQGEQRQTYRLLERLAAKEGIVPVAHALDVEPDARPTPPNDTVVP